MNYIKQLNAFEDWNERNQGSLSASGQLLWYKLTAIANRSGWVEWFQRSNPSLSGMTRMSERTVQTARNELKQVGLIEFIPGKTKNYPTRYKMVKLYEEDVTVAKFAPQTSPNASPNASPQTSALYKHKEKEKEKGDDLPESIRLQGYVSEKLNKAILSPMEIQIVFGWVKKIEQGLLERQWIVDALEITQSRNKRNVSYANGILADWEANGRPDEVRKERDAVEDVPILNFDRYRT